MADPASNLFLFQVGFSHEPCFHSCMYVRAFLSIHSEGQSALISMPDALPVKPRLPLMPLDDAVAAVIAAAQPLVDWETIPTIIADGRVLAVDLLSPLHVPPCDNSAMDGYAMRCADLVQDTSVTAAQWQSLPLPVVQRVTAGSAAQDLQPGTAARIFTGAPIPKGADVVVMQEQCTLQGGQTSRIGGTEKVVIHAIPTVRQNIRCAGEDFAQGAVVMVRGTRMGPAHLGVAASMGMHQLSVVRRPRVALLSSGDELVMPGDMLPQDMPPGAIYNSNRFFLTAMLHRMGCQVTDFGCVPDTLSATQAALRHAAVGHDLVLTSGGVSVGQEDHMKPAVRSLGSLDLWHIAMKPGKPFALGRLHRQLSGSVGVDQTDELPSQCVGLMQAGAPDAAAFMGLPGNPVASWVAFLMLVRPYLLRLQGVVDVAPKVVDAIAAFAWPVADQRREFLRVRRRSDGLIDVFPRQSSGVLTSAAWADGLVDNPPGRTIKPGDTVRMISIESCW